LKILFEKLTNNHPNDWLLALEILELSKDDLLKDRIRKYLLNLSETHPNLKHLIKDGIDLL
jgi:phenylalanine-4-hydroxylase